MLLSLMYLTATNGPPPLDTSFTSGLIQQDHRLHSIWPSMCTIRFGYPVSLGFEYNRKPGRELRPVPTVRISRAKFSRGLPFPCDLDARQRHSWLEITGSTFSHRWRRCDRRCEHSYSTATQPSQPLAGTRRHDCCDYKLSSERVQLSQR